MNNLFGKLKFLLTRVTWYVSSNFIIDMGVKWTPLLEAFGEHFINTEKLY